MSDDKGYVAQAKYDLFSISDSTTGYALNIGNYVPSPILEAGDSLSFHNGATFKYPDDNFDTCAGW